MGGAARTAAAGARERSATRPTWDWERSRAFSCAERLAGMLALAGRCVRAFATPPVSWPREFVEQCVLIVSRCTLPLGLSAAFLSFAVNVIVVGVVVEPLGAEDRLGALTGLDSLREFAAWPTGMVLAGIAGTAICSDLGSRRVREELDALAVLGVDVDRALVLPRVLALAVMTPLMYLWALLIAVVTPGLIGPWYIGFPVASYVESFQSILAVDLLGGLVKMMLVGVAVAVICCFKGLNASGGPEGVGRSVNQAVVTAFATTWVVSLLFNAFFQAAFPETQNLR